MVVLAGIWKLPGQPYLCFLLINLNCATKLAMSSCYAAKQGQVKLQTFVLLPLYFVLAICWGWRLARLQPPASHTHQTASGSNLINAWINTWQWDESLGASMSCHDQSSTCDCGVHTYSYQHQLTGVPLQHSPCILTQEAHAIILLILAVIHIAKINTTRPMGQPASIHVNQPKQSYAHTSC